MVGSLPSGTRWRRVARAGVASQSVVADRPWWWIRGLQLRPVCPGGRLDEVRAGHSEHSNAREVLRLGFGDPPRPFRRSTGAAASALQPVVRAEPRTALLNRAEHDGKGCHPRWGRPSGWVQSVAVATAALTSGGGSSLRAGPHDPPPGEPSGRSWRPSVVDRRDAAGYEHGSPEDSLPIVTLSKRQQRPDQPDKRRDDVEKQRPD